MGSNDLPFQGVKQGSPSSRLTKIGATVTRPNLRQTASLTTSTIDLGMAGNPCTNVGVWGPPAKIFRSDGAGCRSPFPVSEGRDVKQTAAGGAMVSILVQIFPPDYRRVHAPRAPPRLPIGFNQLIFS